MVGFEDAKSGPFLLSTANLRRAFIPLDVEVDDMTHFQVLGQTTNHVLKCPAGWNSHSMSHNTFLLFKGLLNVFRSLVPPSRPVRKSKCARCAGTFTFSYHIPDLPPPPPPHHSKKATQNKKNGFRYHRQPEVENRHFYLIRVRLVLSRQAILNGSEDV